MDAAAVAKGVEQARRDTASIIQYNDENSLACAVYAAYFSAQVYYMKPIRELPSGRGFADVVYLPQRGVDKQTLKINQMLQILQVSHLFSPCRLYNLPFPQSFLRSF